MTQRGVPRSAPHNTLKGLPHRNGLQGGAAYGARGGHSWFNPGWREGVSFARSGIAVSGRRSRT
jgi:hypothetical protein